MTFYWEFFFSLNCLGLLFSVDKAIVNNYNMGIYSSFGCRTRFVIFFKKRFLFSDQEKYVCNPHELTSMTGQR